MKSNNSFRLVAALTGVAMSLSLFAQNPIIRNQFSADPSALVVGDRVFLFPSHDIPAPEDFARKDWFCMADYHVFSSTDLTNWTDHGVILHQKDVPWGNPTAYSMWAPDCAEHNGKYYFYFPDAPAPGSGGFGFRCGVAIADRPEGPYVPQEKFIDGVFGIDPCIFKDDDGQGYLVWPSGGIKICKLKDNWTELDAKLVTVAPTVNPNIPDSIRRRIPPMQQVEGAITVDEVPTKGLVEGPYMFKANGKYYVTFPWARENTEVLAYCMADKIEGPYKFMGVFFEEHPNGCWTNHHSIINFKGQWYLFYHRNDYSPKFDKNRSVCVDSLFFEADGSIRPVKPTLRGVGVTEGTGRIQMDRYSKIGGGASIAYNDTVDYFQGWKTVLPPGGWVSYSNVEIKNDDYNVWVSTPGFWGRSQIVDISETSLSLKTNKQANGYYELVLTNDGNMPTQVDWISLNKHQPLIPASNGGISSGSYRNVFVEAGYDAAAVEAKLQEVFNDVFTGKNRCYFEVGKDKAYISDIKNNDVRTEGMSYGMMIAVQFDRKDIFDRLWNWTKEYMLMKEGPMAGYFRWSCKTDGTANAEGPASDGELYFITSLVFASNRWGNMGEINYLEEAQRILDAIQPRESEFMGQKRTVSLIDQKSGLIAFTPGMPFTDPSYHIPAFYEIWARYAEDGRASYWRECAAKSREYLHKSINSVTGLNPDTNNFDGTMLRGGMPGLAPAFRYDSWRVPMNIALDYSWSCSDRQWQQQYGETFQNFLYSQGIDSFVDQYNVDGTIPEKLIRAGNYPEKLRHSMGLIATSAAASLLCSHAKSYEFIDQLWNTPHKPDADGYFDAYYDGLLRLFAFMHLSGHYRVIERTPQMATYFAPADPTVAVTPDNEGFVHRWTIHDPILKPNRSNTVFVDSYLNETFPAPMVKNKKDKAWHVYDSQLYNVKLYRFATCTGQQRYGVIFWVTTTIECDTDIENVRFSIGSNSASKWWLNGEEAALLSGDRRMVRDDMVSDPLTLHKGTNVVTGAIINGPGMSDFCFRLVDGNGQPLTNVKIK